MKTFSFFVVCVVFASLICSQASALAYGGGTGHSDNPFLINNAEHLNEIGLNSDHWNRHFVVTADIDMAGIDYNMIGGLQSWDSFSGTFDGGGHTISNLSNTLIQRVDFGTIKNVRIENSEPLSVALLVRRIHSGATIDNCFVRGVINTEGHDLGGMVSYIINSTVMNSGSDVVINAGRLSQRVGGLAGQLDLGTISNCFSTSTVIGGNRSRAYGVLVGKAERGLIENCFTYGFAKAAQNVGGIVGEVITPEGNSMTIDNCRSFSDVMLGEAEFSSSRAGGIVGAAHGWGLHINISNCFSAGEISGAAGSDDMGGLIGTISHLGSVTNSASIANVTGGWGSSQLGGLIGMHSDVPVIRSYSAGTVSTQPDVVISAGGISGYASSVTIEDSYSTASVLGASAFNHRAGGLIGIVYYYGYTQVKRSYSTGWIEGQNANIGGFIGANQNDISDIIACFWDMDTSGQTSSDGGKGCPTSVMQNILNYTSVGWDFVGESINGTDDIWEMALYPVLSWQSSIEAHGESAMYLADGEQGIFEIELKNIKANTVDWEITNAQSYGWIEQVSASEGSVAGFGSEQITITVDSAGLAVGNHLALLEIDCDDGKQVLLPLKISVYEPVNFDDFLGLSYYWGVTDCVAGDDCKPYDWYVDGEIDIKDLILFSQGWLSEGVAIYHPSIWDGFESGDFSALDWTFAGDADWVIDDETFYEGSFSASSGSIDHLQTSELILVLDTTGWEADTVGFWCKVSSEEGFDLFRFFINGELKDTFSGEKDWGYLEHQYQITPGVNTFRWVYSKDFSGTEGQDRAWIDNFRVYKMQ